MIFLVKRCQCGSEEPGIFAGLRSAFFPAPWLSPVQSRPAAEPLFSQLRQISVFSYCLPNVLTPRALAIV